jgi:hypothetical protein
LLLQNCAVVFYKDRSDPIPSRRRPAARLRSTLRACAARPGGGSVGCLPGRWLPRWRSRLSSWRASSTCKTRVCCACCPCRRLRTSAPTSSARASTAPPSSPHLSSRPSWREEVPMPQTQHVRIPPWLLNTAVANRTPRSRQRRQSLALQLPHHRPWRQRPCVWSAAWCRHRPPHPARRPTSLR